MYLNNCTAALCLAVLSWLCTGQLTAQEVVDQWRYVLRKPADGWQKPDFDDSLWQTGSGGFGEASTPGARIGTSWTTNNIWLRKAFDLSAVPAQPALLIHHDEDAEVFINGQPAASFTGFITEYKVVPLSPEKAKSLIVGKNSLAVHCRQTGGGQFIDVHLIDAMRVPTLPQPERSTEPYRSDLITQWGKQVTPENVWTEYPRPLMERPQWQNLNGHWDYAITTEQQTIAPEKWDGQILVPFCLESKLGGVGRLLLDSEALWYHRTFQLDTSLGQRTLLNFEAVDYLCEVFVNGRSVGTHRGGHTPFTLDVTSAVQAGRNSLVVRVEDETEKYQLRGKQVINAHGIWYTQVSGIWQTVWLEQVPQASIDDIKISTDAATGSIKVRTDLVGATNQSQVRLVVRDGQHVVAEAKSTKIENAQAQVAVKIEPAKLWSPASPHLYDLELSLLDSNGQVLDQVKSYAGIRTIGKRADEQGHLRFTLNDQFIFHWGPLDQGWWPDGLLTPPSDSAMLYDIEILKAAGFNMIRKHIKVEPRRYYYHCDRLGMLLWQDQVSAGHGPRWTRLEPEPVDAQWPEREHAQFMLELERMIAHLENHPSIVVWVPFNEAWGQHRTVEVGKWLVERDPSRLVNIASGGNFWPVGDIVDEHHYPHPQYPFNEQRDRGFVKVMGEFGGHGYPVPGHMWNADSRIWGYGGLPKSEAEFRDRYAKSIELLNHLRAQGIAAGVYTQTTDVELEINGLMTYDRKVIKIPTEELARLHSVLFQ